MCLDLAQAGNNERSLRIRKCYLLLLSPHDKLRIINPVNVGLGKYVVASCVLFRGPHWNKSWCRLDTQGPFNKDVRTKGKGVMPKKADLVREVA